MTTKKKPMKKAAAPVAHKLGHHIGPVHPHVPRVHHDADHASVARRLRKNELDRVVEEK